jgi:integrase
MKFIDVKTANLNSAISKCDKGHATLKKMKSLYNQLFEYAMTNDIVNKDYSNYIDIGKNKDKTARIPFCQSEIDLLFKTEPTLPFVDTILIMIYSGVRIGELLNVKLCDINIKEGYFIVTDSKTEAGQNRLVPIHSKVLQYFKNRIDTENEYLIVNSKNKKMLYDYYYNYVFKPIMENLNMEHKPHDCRHTFATLLNNADANSTSIKNLVGHNSFITTEKIYTHKDINELKKAVDLIE